MMPVRASRAFATLRFLAAPGTLSLAIRMVWWAALLPILKRVVPIRRLARLAWVDAPPAPRDPGREQRIARLVGLLYRGRLGKDRCLDRSLLLYRYLSAAGADPVLVAGMGQRPDGWQGHAWVEVDGRPFHEEVDVAEFVPTVAFSRRGAVVTARTEVQQH